ncbi:hypothetical protein KI387_034702 [Taxus chinensis]|uniref:Uncharacterized protein n=1 Tax=Taxus chinensis TaxID=29808 RepID=A0AA38BX64_TAXCH|nr:hypothetical protein KI387_034702 [Taxus chinensis]
MKQLEGVDVEFHASSSQSEIELVSSIVQPTNNSSMIQIYNEQASLSDYTFPRLPFPERQISFSWPSSHQPKIEITEAPSHADYGRKDKVPFLFEIVQKEYNDRVRVNYLFIPWIAGMLLRMGLPSHIAPNKVHPVLWCIFMTPITLSELKIYGQWFTKGKRSLARIANPSTHLSVIGNFVVARLATRVEWREAAMLFFTVGLVHYAVLPSPASTAWEAISGSFDTGCKMLLFLSLFLYLALIMRVNSFRDNMGKFSVIWWACAYPMTTTSVAAVKYAEKVKHPIARSLA